MKKLWNGNKTLQRLLALFLCVCLVGTLIPMGVIAAEVEEPCAQCGSNPCECPPAPETCEACGKTPCECPPPVEVCEACGKTPCECPPPVEACETCGKAPCECLSPAEVCETCGKEPCECISAVVTLTKDFADYIVTASGSFPEGTQMTLTELSGEAYDACKALAGSDLGIFFTLGFDVVPEDMVLAVTPRNQGWKAITILNETVLEGIAYDAAATYGVITQAENQTTPPVEDVCEICGNAPCTCVYYDVTFDIGEPARYGVAAPAPVKVLAGEVLGQLPEFPVWEEEGEVMDEFLGWYLDKTFESEAKEDFVVAENVTIYGMWTRDTFFVNTLPEEGDSSTDGQPDIGFITVSKTFEGLSDAQLQQLGSGFQITVTRDNTSKTLVLTPGGEGSPKTGSLANNDRTYTWRLDGLTTGVYDVSENGVNLFNDSHNLTVSVNGEVKTLGPDGKLGQVEVKVPVLNFDQMPEEIKPNENNRFPVKQTSDKNFIFMANLNMGSRVIILSEYPLSSAVQKAIIQKGSSTYTNWKWSTNNGDKEIFYSFAENNYAPIPYAGETISYDNDTGEVVISDTSIWNKAAIGVSYSLSEAKNPDINITNSYTPKTTDIQLTKQVTGNIGDWNKPFRFTVSSPYPFTAKVTPRDGEPYDVNVSGNSATFDLRHDDSVMLYGVRLGSTLTITEDNDGYTASAKWDTNELDNVFTFDVPATAPAEQIHLIVNNHLNASIETGVVLDSLPYILILAVVALVGVLLVTKRKNRD